MVFFECRAAAYKVINFIIPYTGTAGSRAYRYFIVGGGGGGGLENECLRHEFVGGGGDRHPCPENF